MKILRMILVGVWLLGLVGLINVTEGESWRDRALLILFYVGMLTLFQKRDSGSLFDHPDSQKRSNYWKDF